MARIVEGINKAFSDKSDALKKGVWLIESVEDWKIPTVFISYQREDEAYAKRISEYIMSMGLSVFFDLNDKSLKFYNQKNNPKGVTSSIQQGINDSDFMLVIVSPSTMNSGWVPFEVGYAYDAMPENKMACLKHKGITRAHLPHYLKTKQLLEGFNDLENYLKGIRKEASYIFDSLEERRVVKSFSQFGNNPLSEYLEP